MNLTGTLIALGIILMIALITISVYEDIAIQEEFCESKGYNYSNDHCYKIENDTFIKKKVVLHSGNAYFKDE